MKNITLALILMMLLFLALTFRSGGMQEIGGDLWAGSEQLPCFQPNTIKILPGFVVRKFLSDDHLLMIQESSARIVIYNIFTGEVTETGQELLVGEELYDGCMTNNAVFLSPTASFIESPTRSAGSQIWA